MITKDLIYERPETLASDNPNDLLARAQMSAITGLKDDPIEFSTDVFDLFPTPLGNMFSTTDPLAPPPGVGDHIISSSFYNNNFFNTQVINVTQEASPGGGAKSVTLIVGPAANSDSASYDYTTDGTDDDVQIQAAIEALPAGGGKIVLREGTYTVNMNLSGFTYSAVFFTKNNVTIEGMGRSTVVKCKNGWVASRVFSLADRCAVRNIAFDGNRVNRAAGYTNGCIVTGENCEISGCFFYETNGYHIWVGNKSIIRNNYFGDSICFDSDIDRHIKLGHHCLIDGNVFDISDDDPNINYIVDGENTIGSRAVGNTFVISGEGWQGGAINECSVVTGNTFLYAGDDPSFLAINGFSEGGANVSDNIIYAYNLGTDYTQAISCGGSSGSNVSGNSISVVEYGITGSYVNVTGNYIYGFYLEGIQNSYGSVSGNTVWYFGTAGTGHIGIEMLSDVGRGSVCSGNFVYLTGGNTSRVRGIALYGNALHFTFVSITGNSIIRLGSHDGGDTNTVGIWINSAENAIISNNLIRNCHTGIIADSATGATMLRILNCIISGNMIYGNTTGTNYNEGIKLGSLTTANASLNNKITNNTIMEMGKDGISLTNFSYGIVGANTIVNIGTATNDTYSGIILQVGDAGNSTYNTVEGNVIRSDAANKHKYGIREADSSQGPNIMSDNILLNAVTANLSPQHASTLSPNNIAP
jgi:hypothetical protein